MLPDLTLSQRASLKLILSTSDRFIAIQGFAGTGKTTMLSELKKLTESPILGLASIHKAVFGLRKIGLEAQTLKSFLHNFQSEQCDLKGKIIALDEASLIPNKDMAEFTEIIKKHNGRAVIIGDALQYQAIESGKPWDLALVKSQVDRVYATDIVRQQNEALKLAVDHIIQGNYQSSLDHIQSGRYSIERRGNNPFRVVSEVAGKHVIEQDDLYQFVNKRELDSITRLKDKDARLDRARIS